MAVQAYSNDSTHTHNLVVRVKTAKTAGADTVLALESWITRVVNRTFGQYGPKGVDVVGVAGAECLDRRNEQTGQVMDQVVICLHDRRRDAVRDSLLQHSVMEVHDLLVKRECAKKYNPGALDPRAVAASIRTDPPPLDAALIGVSGVTSEYAAETWRAIISPRPGGLVDSAGGGYSVHRMCTWDQTGQTATRVPEASWGFGWGAAHDAGCRFDAEMVGGSADTTDV